MNLIKINVDVKFDFAIMFEITLSLDCAFDLYPELCCSFVTDATKKFTGVIKLVYSTFIQYVYVVKIHNKL